MKADKAGGGRGGVGGVGFIFLKYNNKSTPQSTYYGVKVARTFIIPR